MQTFTRDPELVAFALLFAAHPKSSARDQSVSRPHDGVTGQFRVLGDSHICTTKKQEM
jgi:hypothetical protein